MKGISSWRPCSESRPSRGWSHSGPPTSERPRRPCSGPIRPSRPHSSRSCVPGIAVKDSHQEPCLQSRWLDAGLREPRWQGHTIRRSRLEPAWCRTPGPFRPGREHRLPSGLHPGVGKCRGSAGAPKSRSPSGMSMIRRNRWQRSNGATAQWRASLSVPMARPLPPGAMCRWIARRPERSACGTWLIPPSPRSCSRA